MTASISTGRILTGVIAGLLLLAIFVIAMSVRKGPTIERDCRLFGGTPIHDRDGFRCLNKDGEAIDIQVIGP